MDDIAKLRADYEQLFGKRPFPGWDAKEIQKRIDDNLAGTDDAPKPVKAEKPAQTVPVKLLRAYWPETERVEAGTKMNLTVAEAKRLIEAGVAERADPLPGE
jgi:hypothetical protein